MIHFKHISRFLIAITCILTAPSLAESSVNRFNLLTFKPSLSGFLTVEDAKNPPLRIGTLVNYERSPLDLRVGGVKQREIVDNLFSGQFYAVTPIFSWLSAGFTVPVALRYSFSNPDITSPPSTKHTSFGDINVSAKALLLDLPHFGIAVIPTIFLPTGDDTHFIGNDGVAGGGKLAFYFPKVLKPLDLGVNAGVMSRKRVTVRNINFKEQLALSAAGKVHFTKNISLIAEAETMTPLDEVFKDKNNSPTEIRGALEWNNKYLKAMAGAGTGLVYGAGAAQVSAFALVEFHRDIKRTSASKNEHQEQIQPLLKEIYSVVFKFDSANISDTAAVTLGKIAEELFYNKNIHAKIVGSADDYGDDEHNEVLAKKRTDHVKNYLVMHGVDEERITTENSKPKHGRANRKADIYLN